MTIDELIAEAKQIGGFRYFGKTIRHARTMYCPVCAVADKLAVGVRLYYNSKFQEAAGDINLSTDDAEAIACAADGNFSDPGISILRQRLERELIGEQQ